MEENKNAYSEVVEILKLIDDEKKLEALPIEMLEVLKLKANPEYKPQISKEIPLEEQNLQPETFSILSWIALKYWDEEIEEITNLEPQEELKKEEPKNEEQNIEQEKLEDEASILPILYKDLRWYQKIRVKIIEIFHKIFKKDKREEIERKEEGTIL